ncbi:hypothetical protein R6Q57_018775 [Mikania cordata]
MEEKGIRTQIMLLPLLVNTLADCPSSLELVDQRLWVKLINANDDEEEDIITGSHATSTFDDRLPESRMEKLLRDMVQNSQGPSARNLINDIKPPHNKGKAANDETQKVGSTWVKTDSEYIVLEI